MLPHITHLQPKLNRLAKESTSEITSAFQILGAKARLTEKHSSPKTRNAVVQMRV